MMHRLLGAPLELPSEIVRRWPELARARYRRGGLVPRLGGWALGASKVDGIALGRTVWLDRHAPLDPGLLLHELRHVQQFQQHAFFALRYVWETLRRGYRENRFEADARCYAERRLREA